MLYWITQQLPARIPGAHVFAYLTFRAILATASALGLSLLVGPSLIRHLVRGQIGQVVRDDGPPTHLLKAGTPTMGGTLILVATLVSTLLWAELTNRLVWTVLGVTFAFGLIGFYDDYLKLMVRNPKGLVPRWKYFWQSVAGLATAASLYYAATDPAQTTLFLPFFKTFHAPLTAFGYIAIAYLMIVGMSNAVNLTDGLDGLAIMPAALVASALGIFAYASGNAVFAHYLQIPDIRGAGELLISCARYLLAQGWRLAVTDTRAAPPELPALRALGPDIPVRGGALDAALLEGATCVVVSPGLPREGPFFAEARRRGLGIIGDIELFARAVDAPVAGVTGTNGKSTVTTLLARMAQRAGVRVRAGGNLGEPALALLGGGAELYVLELSSFQLETTQSLACRAATVLNVSPDHLDRYAQLASYAAAKARIYERCETAVINLDDPLTVAMPRRASRTLSFSLRGAGGADYTLSVKDRESWLARSGAALMP